MKKLILASKSPRRKKILSDNGFSFQTAESGFCEKAEGLNPKEVATLNAKGKAEEVYASLTDKTVVVLGADTVVYINGELLGKPKTARQAEEMLSMLSGKTHKVVTGVAFVSDFGTKTTCVESEVTFNDLSKQTIKDYVKTGSPMDKAGAYGVQDDFGIVKKVSGSFLNVVGLPIEEIKTELSNMIK